jgi:hypothetical protein
MMSKEGSIRKEPFTVYNTYNWKKPRKPYVRINGNQAEIRTENLPDTIPERYQYAGVRDMRTAVPGLMFRGFGQML